jgi:hypothetical protein
MKIGVVVLIIWLIIGAVAAGQRHYYTESSLSCSRAGTIFINVVAGPLNYIGVNPKIGCHVPKPS